MVSTEALKKIIETARQAGAEYAEVRWSKDRGRRIRVRDGETTSIDDICREGLVLRCFKEGAWGVASTPAPFAEDAERLVRRALSLIVANKLLDPSRMITLAPTKGGPGDWEVAFERDPLHEDLSLQRETLRDIDRVLKAVGQTCATRGEIVTERRERVLVTSEGHEVVQRTRGVGIDYQVAACHDDRIFWRSLGPHHYSGGWERLFDLYPRRFARQMAQEAAMIVLEPREFPGGSRDVLIMPDVMAVLLHETIGHNLDAENVLEQRSLLDAESWKGFEMGASILNVTADPTLEHAMGRCGFDDEGTPTRPWPLIREGVVVDLITGRETAAALGLGSSRGAMRAGSPLDPPQVMVPNLVMSSGAQTNEALVARVGDGLQIYGPRSWSLDERRRHIVIRCEVAQAIVEGKFVYFYPNPVISVDTQALWSRCEALGDDSTREMVSIPNQRKRGGMAVGVSHSVVSGVFRGVDMQWGRTVS